MITRLFTLLVLLISAPVAIAQFSDAWIRHGDYWNDGKAEFNIYEAKQTRYGASHPSQIIHIYVRENFAAEVAVKADDWKSKGTYPVLKLNQIINVPTGIYVYQQMHSAFWRIKDSELIKFSLTSNDSCGNTFKVGERKPSGRFLYRYHTYWEGMVSGYNQVSLPEETIFYDELPMRVRTIDFSKGDTTFPIKLTNSIINSKRDVFATDGKAAVTVTTGDDTHKVEVNHPGGSDIFEVGAAFPHLLHTWSMADGGKLVLKHSLKIDYWNYNQPGDLERALQSPTLDLLNR